jgi:hypothetical protein
LALTPGTRLGVYEITASIGEGGMGQVFRARDTRLDRDVAIKILPEAFAHDADRLARLQREAKTLASLNHPNIAAIYGLEESGGITALVMELVEGDDLSQRIARGAIPIDESLAIAKQIAEALEAAHEQGIVHRDLKPANIKVRPDGTVKVLDLGLAKATEPAAGSSPSVSMSPTLTTPAMTHAGMILGTAAYMSPEQSKGRVADKRSDVWAFGCVLYEMLTGKRAFEGDDVSDTLAAILRAEPDWTALPAEVPPAIRALVARCLAKDRKQRMRDIGDVQLVLNGAFQAPAPPAGAAPVAALPRRRILAIASVTLLVGAAAAALATWAVMRPLPQPAPQLVRFAVAPAGTLPLATNSPFRDLTLSPDGTHLVYATGTTLSDAGLWVHALDQLDAVPLRGLIAPQSPFISPDGQWIGFFSGGTLMKVSMTGGPPIPLCHYQGAPRGASWGPNDTIVFATAGASTGLFSVPGGGGEPKVLTTPDAKHGEVYHVSPSVLPGGQAVLFTIPTTTGLDTAQVAVLDLKTGQRKVLVRGGSAAEYVETGHLLYAAAGTLRAVRFDPVRLEVLSDPVPVVERVLTKMSGAAEFSVSRHGALVYVPGSAEGTTATKLVQVARDGTRSPLADITGMTWFPRFSPDGSRIAYGVSASGDTGDPSDLWVLDARGARTRVTFTGNNRFYPIWTRDGTRLTFGDGTGATNRILSTLADGTGGLQTLMDVGTRRYPTSWSPDGRTLAFYVGGVTNTRDIWMLHRDADKWTPAPFIETSFEERGAIFSADGRWVAYVSNKSGQNDIYARPYPGPGGEVTISVGGGREPVWAPSGRELFYRHAGKLLAVRIDETASSLTVGAPTRVFDDPYRLDTGGAQGGVANYDISPDGRRFVMVEEPRASNSGAPAAPQIQVVLNWFEELKARVPTK